MTEVVLYHHVQGLTDGVAAFAEELRGAGHTVHTPDLFDGRTFATIDEGMAHARSIGFGVLLERGVAAAPSSSSDGLVYAGLSMGAMLLHACLPVSEFGERWPEGVPVQVHGMDADPFFAGEGGDIDVARELVASTDQAELFLYPGDQHLFTDSSLPAYDADAARLLTDRVLRFLDSL